MQAAGAQRIETGIGHAAAASFAAAVGFAAYQAVDRITNLPVMLAAGGIAAVIAYPAAQLLLKLLAGRPRPFPQPVFDTLKIEPVELGELLLTDTIDELLLTDADRLPLGDAVEPLPLELDDILVEIAPDSRVVQLFDRSAMPTPGQLKARMDRHLDGGTSQSPPPDASEALFAALADLRRSLR